MAAAPELAWRIDRYLAALAASVEDLPNLVAEWDELPDGERASTSLHWDHLLADYLTELDEHYRANVMTAAQRERYEELRRRLGEASPLLSRLGFTPVPLPIEDETRDALKFTA
ncbi:MAG: hypothetical protein HY690_09520 [Chloroflexi bacterium]|nr:hypothetical protein [Chloroflexota bacterium]